MAFLTLSFYRSAVATGPRLLFPFVVAGLPLLDVTLAIIRRIRGRASPFFGDRRHIYDLLAARGASARMVALVCYVATALLGLIGFVGVRATVYFFILASGGGGALLVTAIRMGALRLDRERIQQGRKALAEPGQ